MVLLRHAFELEDALEVGVGAVADEVEVGLDEPFRRGGADLEGFEKRVDLGHGLVDALDVACWRGRRGWNVWVRGGAGGWMVRVVEGEEVFEGFGQDVFVKKHLVWLC